MECVMSTAARGVPGRSLSADDGRLQLQNSHATPPPTPKKTPRRLKPGYGDAHCDLGCVYCALEQHTQAKRQFENAIACDPWHLEAHFNRGNLLRQSGDLPGAIESYDRVLAADPGHWRSLLNKAVVQTCLGAAKEEAAENLRLAMKLSGGWEGCCVGLVS